MVDEAHRLRTAGNKLTDCLAAILNRGELEYGFQLRLLMTGTPLQVKVGGGGARCTCLCVFVCSQKTRCAGVIHARRCTVNFGGTYFLRAFTVLFIFTPYLFSILCHHRHYIRTTPRSCGPS